VPSLSEIIPAIERAGLIVSDVEVLRLHYAETPRQWPPTLRARLPASILHEMESRGTLSDLRHARREGLMPLYAYSCQDCNSEFELLVRSSDVPACPSCGSQKLQQQVARISSKIKYPAIARSWRQAAARSGELSNFSKQEQGLKKG